MSGSTAESAAFAQAEAAARAWLARLDPASDVLLIEAGNEHAKLAVLRAWLSRGGTGGFAAASVIADLAAERIDDAPCDLFRLPQKLAPPLGEAGLVAFTSASSGPAKGILRCLSSWQRTYALQRETLATKRTDRPLVAGDLGHSLHLYGAMEALDRGVMPTLLVHFSPRAALAACRRDTCSLLYATPAHLNLILAVSAGGKVEPLPLVRHILAGGAKLGEQHLANLAALFPNAHITEFFGTTETSYMTMKAPGDPIGSVGRPCRNVTIRIGDDPTHPAPPETKGLIWVRSDMLFDRYLTGSDANTSWRDGFLTVGDEGHLDTNGYLYFAGRRGNMVVIAGENVYLDEIERALAAALPAGEVAVVALPDPMRGQRVIAACQHDWPAARRDEALKALRLDFGPVKAPRRLLHIAEWPMRASGKTDRPALKQMIRERL